MTTIDWSALRSAQKLRQDRLESARERAQTRIVQAISEASDAITGQVPTAEQLSWAIKETAARAVLTGQASIEDRTILTAEAAITGQHPDDLARAILANADAWRLMVARFAGLRRKVLADIAQATDPAEVEAMADKALADLAALVRQGAA
jgi:hypothetical protein